MIQAFLPSVFYGKSLNIRYIINQTDILFFSFLSNKKEERNHEEMA